MKGIPLFRVRRYGTNPAPASARLTPQIVERQGFHSGAQPRRHHLLRHPRQPTRVSGQNLRRRSSHRGRRPCCLRFWRSGGKCGGNPWGGGGLSEVLQGKHRISGVVYRRGKHVLPRQSDRDVPDDSRAAPEAWEGVSAARVSFPKEHFIRLCYLHTVYSLYVLGVYIYWSSFVLRSIALVSPYVQHLCRSRVPTTNEQLQ